MKLSHLLFALLVIDASAQTTVGLWRMGEDDSGAANNAPLNTTLTAAVGPDLSLNGGNYYSGVYTSSTPGAASSLAVKIVSGSVTYITGSNFGLTTDFALEAWVKIGAGGSDQYIAQLGSGGSNSLGLFVEGGTDFLGVQTGNTLTSSVPVFGNSFTIAGNFEESSTIFSGSIDQVRIFTFANGTFNPSMLTYPASAIPEPSTYAGLVGAVTFALVVVRRRRAAA